MRKIKILGLFVILVVGLSLALTGKLQARPPSATPDVMMLQCDRGGLFEESESDNMSTAGGAGVEDFAASASACDDDGDTCGGCLASLLASTNNCKYDLTYVANLGKSSSGHLLIITVICKP